MLREDGTVAPAANDNFLMEDEDKDTSDATTSNDEAPTPDFRLLQYSYNVHNTAFDVADADVVWSTLDIGLQSYIFGHLARELKDPSRIGQALGLDQDEILNSLHILNMQLRYPLSTHQLYSFCVSLSGGPGDTVDPDILKQYMNYFGFSSNFEVTTQNQRLLAYYYLRQRKIRGEFVDALTRGQNELQTGQVQEIPSANVSHVHRIMRRLVQSPYFPPSIRKNLLVKNGDNLSELEAWAVDGSSLPEQTQSRTLPAVLNRKAVSQYVMRSLRSLRQHFLGTKSSHSYGSRDAIEIHLLQLTVAFTAQLQTLRSRVNGLTFNNERESKTVSRAARKRLEARLIKSFKQSIIRQLKADFRGLHPTSSGRLLSLAKSHYMSESESESAGEDESSQRSTTSSTIAVQDQDVQSDIATQSRARSASTSSFHTAQDVADQLEDIHIPAKKSPQRPDISPIDSDDELVGIEPQPSPAPHTVSNQIFPLEFFQNRATPWKSARQSIIPNTQPPPPPTMNSTTRTVPFPTNNAYPPLLAGIHEAALAKSPSSTSAKSLNSASRTTKPKTAHPQPPRLKFKPLVRTEVSVPQTITSRPDSPTSAAESDDPVSKPPKAPRSDKGKKRGIYNTKKKMLVTKKDGNPSDSKSAKK